MIDRKRSGGIPTAAARPCFRLLQGLVPLLETGELTDSLKQAIGNFGDVVFLSRYVESTWSSTTTSLQHKSKFPRHKFPKPARESGRNTIRKTQKTTPEASMCMQEPTHRWSVFILGVFAGWSSPRWRIIWLFPLLRRMGARFKSYQRQSINKSSGRAFVI